MAQPLQASAAPAYAESATSATLQQSVVATLHESLAALRGEAATDFKWIVGIQVTTLIAVVAALLGALAAR
jgi:hypothetical protein